jgi:hypothetical protein
MRAEQGSSHGLFVADAARALGQGKEAKESYAQDQEQDWKEAKERSKGIKFYTLPKFISFPWSHFLFQKCIFIQK